MKYSNFACIMLLLVFPFSSHSSIPELSLLRNIAYIATGIIVIGVGIGGAVIAVKNANNKALANALEEKFDAIETKALDAPTTTSKDIKLYQYYVPYVVEADQQKILISCMEDKTEDDMQALLSCIVTHTAH